MKLNQIILTVLIVNIFSTTCNAQINSTVVKGVVHDWPTDTVYFCELTFHSPLSYAIDYYILDTDSSFTFSFDDKYKPFVFCLSPYKNEVKQKVKTLLTDNLTDQHFWGHCIKIYTYGATTYLIEPQTKLDINVTYNSWIEQLSPEMALRWKKLGVNVFDDNTVINIGKTKIEFAGSEGFKNSYFQNSFNLDDKSDNALSKMSSKNIHLALINLENTKKGLLADLEMNKEKLSLVFYDYIKAEIEFGARKEFLKYLRYDKEDYFKNIIATGEIPGKFFEIITFDKSAINDAVLISEEYNEYLEFYLNFIMNITKKEYTRYNVFSIEKLMFALEELPEASVYFYVANQLLIADSIDEYKGIYNRITTLYPQGELNNRLKIKFKK